MRSDLKRDKNKEIGKVEPTWHWTSNDGSTVYEHAPPTSRSMHMYNIAVRDHAMIQDKEKTHQ